MSLRLSNHKKETLISKIQNGESINKISSSLGLAKSTIYYYYKKIKGKKYKEPQYKIRFSEIEGEIIGIFVGDGSQTYYKPHGNYRTNIHFGNNPKYVQYVKKIYEDYFNKKLSVYKEITKRGNIKHILRAENKKIFHYFSNYIDYDRRKKHCSVRLIKKSFPKEFKIGFLRGLIDTDGTVANYDNRIRVQHYTISKMLAKQVKDILKELQVAANIYKISRKKWKDLYTIQVCQKDVDKFLKLIKPYKANKIGPVD